MGVPFDVAERHLETAVNQLFGADPSVRSVGITRHGDAFGYRAVRNSDVIAPFNTAAPTIHHIRDVPVVFADSPGEVESLVAVAPSGPTSPAATSLVPEVNRQRDLVSGLQIQNFDDDARQQTTARGYITVGTLGCFVRLPNGRTGLLSNNHVIAGQNAGIIGADRILQPGSDAFQLADLIGTLADFVAIQASQPAATPATGGVVLNDSDVGVAELATTVTYRQGYLAARGLIAPFATARARPGDTVFKVGRTTGLTYGEVKDAAAVVGPVAYPRVGPCWFRRSLVIEGDNNTQFSDKGDSGALIVRTNGEAVGLLYAGKGQQTYACPIDAVLAAFSCTLA